MFDESAKHSPSGAFGSFVGTKEQKRGYHKKYPSSRDLSTVQDFGSQAYARDPSSLKDIEP